MAEAGEEFRRTGRKQRRLTEFAYATVKSWNRERRAVARLEHGPLGPNPRCVAASLSDPDIARLCDGLYCARGEMENRIKEQQLHLFADRASCHRWWPNQFRLLLSGLACVLADEIRRRALRRTRLARAQVHTIRLRMLKIGAVLRAQHAQRVAPPLPAPARPRTGGCSRLPSPG